MSRESRIEKANLETARQDYAKAVRHFESAEHTYRKARAALHDAVEALDRLENPESWPRSKAATHRRLARAAMEPKP